MRKSSAGRFADLKAKALGEPASTEPVSAPSRRSSILGKRQAEVAAVASGKVKTIKIFGHDPARIRPWSGHNRDYSALSKERCADLIEGFRRADQQFPAVVRLVEDSDDFDYEFICGARRHWTANYLKRDLIVEVRNLTDRGAFLLQDIENRDREDISDYERACDYARALPVYFENKKSHMAEQLQIDQGNFTRFLALADLPKDIVDAYADVRELLTHHGTLYTKFLKEPDVKKRVLAAAKALKGQGGSGKDVVAKLKRAAAGMKPASGRQSTRPRIRRGTVSAVTTSKGDCTLSFPIPGSDNVAAILTLRDNINAVIDELTQTSKASPKPTRKVTDEEAVPS